MDAPDHDLLRKYADHRDETAFAEVVRRHVDLVHATALRLLNGDRHHAQDVNRAMFCTAAMSQSWIWCRQRRRQRARLK